MNKFVLLASIGLAALCCPNANADASGAFLYGAADPPVIYNDGASTFTLQIATTKTGVTSVAYLTANSLVPMYDDGTHGDKVAGDGIYSCSGLTHDPIPLGFNGFAKSSVFARIATTDGQIQDYNVDLGFVAVGLQVPFKKLANGIYATPWALFVVDSAWGAANGFLSSESGSTTKGVSFLKRATHALYSVFPDQFDFVVAMPGRPIFDSTANYSVGAPFSYPTNNTVQHIGLVTPPGEDSNWGSKGKLQHVVFHDFSEGSILTHEIGHRWAAFAGTSQNVSACPDCQGAHWNRHSDVTGVMAGLIFDSRVPAGGGYLTNNGNGSWRLVRDMLNLNGSYSTLDLYLMGLVPGSAFPPINLLSNLNLTDVNHITGTVATYSVLQLTGGERSPSFPKSPAQFSTAFVIVKDNLFTAAEFTFFSLLAQYYTAKNPPIPLEFAETTVNPFATATNKRATMTASLPVGALPSPKTSYYSVLHGGTVRPGPLAPGSLVVVRGAFSSTPVSEDPNQVSYSMNGVSMQFDGANIRLYSLNTQSVEGAIPQNATPGVHLLTVTRNGAMVFSQQIAITARNIAALTWLPDSADPTNRAPTIRNTKLQFIGNPALSSKYAQASHGDTLIITATGGGATSPSLDDSAVAPPPGTYTILPPPITIDGAFSVPINITFAGRALASFSRDEVVFIVPLGLTPGPHTIMLGSKVYKNALWIK